MSSFFVRYHSSCLFGSFALYPRRTCWVQLTLCFAKSEFSAWTFEAFLCIARGGLVFAEGRSNSPCFWDYAMFVSLPSSVCEKFESMSILTWPRATWPIVVVLRWIGWSAWRRGLSINKVCVKCLMFHYVLRLRAVVVTLLAIVSSYSVFAPRDVITLLIIQVHVR